MSESQPRQPAAPLEDCLTAMERLLDCYEEAVNGQQRIESDSLETVVQNLICALGEAGDISDADRHRLNRIGERVRHFSSFLEDKKAHIKQELDALIQRKQALMAYTRGMGGNQG